MGRALLIKADLISSDIYRMCNEVPSEYYLGKEILAKASSTFHSNLKKSVKIMERARKFFASEYAVAVRYAEISDSIAVSTDEKVKELDFKYRESLRKGDYSGASKILSKMLSNESLFKVRHAISVTTMAHGNGRMTVVLSNSVNVTIEVCLMTVSIGGVQFYSKTSAPFIIQPLSTMELIFEIGDVHEDQAFIRVEYYNDSILRSISTSASLIEG